MQVNPSLDFKGRCEEALNYYCQIFGTKVDFLMRYKESPDPSMTPPGGEEKIMHASFQIGDTMIMAGDTDCSGSAKFEGICLAVSVAEADQARRIFDSIAKEGQTQMPLMETFFSPAFGIVLDKFGVSWMLYTAPPQES